MLVSWRWISEYVNTEGVAPADFAERFTMSVAEIEGVQTFGEGLQTVCVADVLEVSPHPAADKLRLARIDVGQQELVVVCGAPNLAVGQRLAFAPPGTTLPSGIEVRLGAIRGVESPGMLCSERDLGLSDDHGGLLVLDGCSSGPGTPLPDALELLDTLFEIDNKSITHRPDLWGHHGIAREIAALLDVPLKPLDVHGLAFADKAPVHLRVDSDSGCSRYLCARIDGVQVAPSPINLRLRLRSLGVRPISNVVDATNLAMLETGNPLHAFDARFLRDDTIIVRRASADEVITTLDEQDRPLTVADCVIADANGPVALAGIMGGADSEIRDDTSEVILEAANFDGAQIRLTSTRLGLRTESSARFEKGLDPQTARLGGLRFLKLLAQLCPEARIISQLADIGPFCDTPPAPVIVSTLASYLRSRLGVSPEELSDQWMDRTLASLGFEVARQGDLLSVTVPSFRAGRDVGIAEDLVEELGRIWGYDRVRSMAPNVPARPPVLPPLRPFERGARASLSLGARLTEVLLYAFDHEPTRARLGLAELGQDGEQLPRLGLRNAISAESTRLRRSLVPNLLAAMERNLERGTRDAEGQKGLRVGLFEIGRAFIPVVGDEGVAPDRGIPAVLEGEGKAAYVGRMGEALAEGTLAALAGATPLPWQPRRLAIAIGERLGGGADGGGGAVQPPESVTRSLYHEAVAAVQGVFAELGRLEPTVRRLSEPGSLPDAARQIAGAVDLQPTWLHPARHGAISCGDQFVGLITLIHPEIRQRLAVPAEIVLVELDLDALLSAPLVPVPGASPPRFPVMSFDLTIRCRPEIRTEALRLRLEAAAKGADAGIFEAARFIARFDGPVDDPMGRALTFRISCRHAERTLSERELGAVEKAVLAHLRDWLNEAGEVPPIALPGRPGGSQ